MKIILFLLLFLPFKLQAFEPRVWDGWKIVVVNDGGREVPYSVMGDTVAAILTEIQAENQKAMESDSPIPYFSDGLLNDEIFGSPYKKTPGRLSFEYNKKKYMEARDKRKKMQEDVAAGLSPLFTPPEEEFNQVDADILKYEARARHAKDVQASTEVQVITP